MVSEAKDKLKASKFWIYSLLGIVSFCVYDVGLEAFKGDIINTD